MRKITGQGIVTIAGLLMSAMAVVALAQGTSAVGPSVKPAAVAKKAGSAPPASATKTKTAGKTAVKTSTANSATDDDSFWVEQLDMDGDGNVEDSSLVWDDEDKVLFAHSEGAFTCKNGATGSGEMLVATFAAGNARSRPPGSGFWVAAVDKGECGAQAAALWGCRFDASGSETACGIVTIDEKNDDVVIVTAQKVEILDGGWINETMVLKASIARLLGAGRPRPGDGPSRAGPRPGWRRWTMSGTSRWFPTSGSRGSTASSTVRGLVEVPVEKSFSDVMSDFDIGFLGHFEGRKNRWGFAFDILFLGLDAPVAESAPVLGALGISADVRQVMTEGLAFYRVANGGQKNNPSHVDVLVGARYFGTSAPAPERRPGDREADPELGRRARRPAFPRAPRARA